MTSVEKRNYLFWPIVFSKALRYGPEMRQNIMVAGTHGRDNSLRAARKWRRGYPVRIKIH